MEQFSTNLQGCTVPGCGGALHEFKTVEATIYGLFGS